MELKKLNIGKGLKSTPIINKASGIKPIINKKKVKKRKQYAKGLKILE